MSNSNKNKLHHYIVGTAKLGSGFGTVLILVYLISGGMLLSTPEAILHFGVFAGFGYGIAGFVLLIIFARFGDRIRRNHPTQNTLGDILSKKLKPLGFNILIFLLCIIALTLLTIEGVIAVFIFQLLNFPISIGLSILITFCVIYAGIGGAVWIQRFAVIQILFIFMAIIILPLFFFFQSGLEEVYNSINLYHPYLLVVTHNSFLYIVIGFLIGGGFFLTDLALWQRLFKLENKMVSSTLIMTGFIYFTIPLSLSSFFIVVLASGGFETILSLWYEFQDILFQMPILLILFLLFIFSAITSTMGGLLHAMNSLFLKNILKPSNLNGNRLFRTTLLLSVIIGTITIIIVNIVYGYSINFILILGNLLAALLIPMVIILLSKRTVSSYIPVSAIISAASGYISIYFAGPYHSIWISTLTSAILILFYYFFSFYLTRSYKTEI